MWAIDYKARPCCTYAFSPSAPPFLPFGCLTMHAYSKICQRLSFMGTANVKCSFGANSCSYQGNFHSLRSFKVLLLHPVAVTSTNDPL